MRVEKHAGRLWASTLGGPLLVLEESRLSSWRGFEGGDYERACAVRGDVGRIDVGDGHGLVLGDEPAMTAAAVRPDGVVFVRWHAADDPPEVERAIAAVERSATVDAADEGLVLHWHGPALIVLDSVEPGGEQVCFDLRREGGTGNGALRVPFATGQYSVRVGQLDRRVGSLSLVQLLRA
jgi:hypothetical protein